MRRPAIDWALVRHVVALIIVFATTFALSASVTIFNKWFFTDCDDVQPGCEHEDDPECVCRGWGFRFPVVVTAANMLTSYIYSTACIMLLPARLFGGLQALVIDRETYIWRTVPYAVLFSAVISLDNWAFRYIQVTFYEILKSFHPAILLVATLVAGLEKFSFLLVATVCLICTGLAVASVGEVAFSAIGMAMIVSAISLSSVSQVLEQKMLHGREKPRVHPMVLLNKTMPISFVVLVPVVAMTAYFGGLVGWLKGQSTAHLLQTLALFLAESVLVFGLNIANFLCILYTSAITVSIAGTIKTIIVFCTSWLFFRNRVTVLEVCGYCICLCGIALYNYMKYRHYKATHDDQGATVALPTAEASADGAYTRLQQEASDDEGDGDAHGSDNGYLWVQSEAIVLGHHGDNSQSVSRQTSGHSIGADHHLDNGFPAIPHVPDGLLDPDTLMHRLESIPLVDTVRALAH